MVPSSSIAKTDRIRNSNVNSRPNLLVEINWTDWDFDWRIVILVWATISDHLRWTHRVRINRISPHFENATRTHLVFGLGQVHGIIWKKCLPHSIWKRCADRIVCESKSTYPPYSLSTMYIHILSINWRIVHNLLSITKCRLVIQIEWIVCRILGDFR